MSRRRDYQPTIERARSQAEIAQRREAKLREKKDDCHREMLRAQAAARIAGEEADALRDRIVGLEQSVRDLRREGVQTRGERDEARRALAAVTAEVETLAAWAQKRHPIQMAWDIVRQWVIDGSTKRVAS